VPNQRDIHAKMARLSTRPRHKRGLVLYNISMNSTPDEQEDWYSETYGGTGEFEIESDVDECFYTEDDSFDDKDLY